MNKVIEKLGNHRAKISIVPTMKGFLNEIAKENPTLKQGVSLLLQNPNMGDQILDMLAQQDKAMAEELRAMLRMTITPTIIHGGVKENIIPSECEAVFDCRILPGQNTKEAMEYIKNLLGDVGLEKLDFEIIQANDPSESPSNTPLYELIVNVLKEFEPNCSAVPFLLTGGTDSRFFRRMGSICYGFEPMRADLPYGEILRMAHGIDERISIENLIFGTSVLYTVVEKFLS
jgi:acetylornithine deacetylase/succinyl-diaminopimelate desuccinylase-like protein